MEPRYIDIYQTHWQTTTTPIADTMAALLKLKEQGKIRAIGVSNVSLEQLKAYGPIDSAQEKLSMIDRGIEQSGILPYCRQHGIAVLAYSPLAHGLLSGKIHPNQQFRAGDVRKDNPRYSPENIDRINAMLDQFRPIAERHQATLAQACHRLDLCAAGRDERVVRRPRPPTCDRERRRQRDQSFRRRGGNDG